MAACDHTPFAATAFANIPEVERVYAYHSGDVLRILIVVDRDSDDDLFKRIHAHERHLMHTVRERIRFNVLARRGRVIDELVGDRIPVWYRLGLLPTA